jgi:hypothetical protein
LEFIGPKTLGIEDTDFSILDKEGNTVESANHHQSVRIRTEKPVKPGFIIRKKLN